MPKNNEITKRVFADIAEAQPGTGLYDRFLAVDEQLNLPISSELEKLKTRYDVLSRSCSDDIKSLASLEEIIIQIRCKEVINSELRLSLSRNYIYARSIFFRRGKEINDIRVVVGTVEAYPYPLEDLLKDDEFRLMCGVELNNAMNREIEKNISQLNTVYANE